MYATLLVASALAAAGCYSHLVGFLTTGILTQARPCNHRGRIWVSSAPFFHVHMHACMRCHVAMSAVSTLPFDLQVVAFGCLISLSFISNEPKNLVSGPVLPCYPA